ncbi:MAG: hypothetical protein HY584_05260 [Candidatus Omnitrophica bacterium]|nr:hypothetical protein [Candidatus Omnitrophota bacterium]
MNDRSAWPTLSFRFAVVSSVVIHLLCVTVVEAAVMISKVIAPERPPVITIQTSLPVMSSLKLGHRSIDSEDVSEVASVASLPRNDVIARRPEADEAISNSHSDLRNSPLEDGFPKTQSRGVLDQKLKNFQEAQTVVDKRIQKFKNNLTVLSTPKDQTSPPNALISYVSDLEKVPGSAKKDLLPIYLKKMRSKIAQHWYRRIHTLGPGSQAATIRYRVMASGALSEVEIHSFDGSRPFAEACLAAVSESSPLDPLPFHFEPWVQKKYLSITLTFYFRKTRS